MQAARDYEGKGCMEKACDRKDAKFADRARQDEELA